MDATPNVPTSKPVKLRRYQGACPRILSPEAWEAERGEEMKDLVGFFEGKKTMNISLNSIQIVDDWRLGV